MASPKLNQSELEETPRSKRELLLREKYGRFLSEKEIEQVGDYYKKANQNDDE